MTVVFILLACQYGMTINQCLYQARVYSSLEKCEAERLPAYQPPCVRKEVQ